MTFMVFAQSFIYNLNEIEKEVATIRFSTIISCHQRNENVFNIFVLVAVYNMYHVIEPKYHVQNLFVFMWPMKNCSDTGNVHQMWISVHLYLQDA